MSFVFVTKAKNDWYNVKRYGKIALAGWLSWLECRSVHQKVAGLIPAQGTYLGCRFVPQLGHMKGNWSMFLSHIDVCLSVFPPAPNLPLSLNINEHVLRQGLKKEKEMVKLVVYLSLNYMYSWEITS